MKHGIDSALFLIAISLNLLAIYFGANVYADQFALHPPYLAIFVPDCPLYAFLALLIILGAVKNDLFSFIVSIGMVKYGLWTVFVLFFHSGYYFAPGLFNISAIFVLGHIGMALEGLALLPKKQLALPALALAMGWFLLNDFSDYFLGTVPLIPPGGLDTLRNLTIASSILLPLAIFAFSAGIGKNALVAWLRRILFRAG
ncbi:MAG: DUF1405 domain-containing protein [Candidatus Micrarchaeia archaeon]|jgi:uncharacterized membrane protein YpjA